MATFTVTTAKDVVDAGDGFLSLREALTAANGTKGADAIRFAASVQGHTVVLAGSQLTASADVSIDGGSGVTIDADEKSRVLLVRNSGTDVALDHLTITGGQAAIGLDGGGVLARAGTTLALNHSRVDGNGTAAASADGQDTGSGGGIAADVLRLVASTVSGNHTGDVWGGSDFDHVGTGDSGDGGGISARSVTLVDSTVTDNHVGGSSFYHGGLGGSGGGISAETVSLIGSSVTANSAGDGGYFGRTGGSGGGISAVSVRLDDSVVDGNRTGSGDSYNRWAGSGGGISCDTVTMSRSTISDNTAGGLGTHHGGAHGGGIAARIATLTDSTVRGNVSYSGGGIQAGEATLTDCTLAANDSYRSGSGISGGSLSLSSVTVTGNIIHGYYVGSGVFGSTLRVSNSIIIGNSYHSTPADAFADEITSNGHNIFGDLYSGVGGAVPGDRIGIAPTNLFAAIDPETGGGQLNADGIVPLRDSPWNLALSAGDLLAALPTDQLGHPRPAPAGGLPDIGAAELSQRLFSTAPSNGIDVITGTAADDVISALKLHDLVRGLGGNDRLNGNDGADRLEGGSGRDTLDGGDGGDLLIGGGGNDRLIGGLAVDLASFAGRTAVVVDLSLATDKATRGSEVDTLVGVEGAIGSSAADSFRGDDLANSFQGGLGQDRFTGGGGRDLYDLDRMADSPNGSARRDVITDFAHLDDVIDLSGIDADTIMPGNQAFHWVGTAAFTGDPGELGYFTSGGDTIVRASDDTDAAAELQIQLTGIKVLSEADFFL